MSRPNENEIINALRSWYIEVESGWNDGWNRYHYLDKILKVKKYVEESLSKYEAREFKEE